MQRVITLSAMHFPYPVEHEVPLFLAPMSGVSESPFRLLCRRFGADVVVSEFISAVGVARGLEQVLEAAGDADGRDEFRHDDVRPEAAAQQPEGGLRHPRHGGEEQGEIVPRVVREVHETQRNDALREEQPAITFRRRFDRRDATCACVSSLPKTPSTCSYKAPPKTTS